VQTALIRKAITVSEKRVILAEKPIRRWVLVAFIIACTGSAHSDSPARPFDYITLTKNGRFAMVMLVKGPAAGERITRYKTSGFYAVDEPTKPLWTIDWYAFNVLISSDGRYLVRFGPWAGSVKQLAIAFYDKGKLLHEYVISDLVKDYSTLQYSVSHFFWLKDYIVDEKKVMLTLTTYEKITYQFNLRTGLIVSATR